MRPILIASLLWWASALSAQAIETAQTVWLEEMTSPEVKSALAAGKTTVVIPTGGTEQNGPHIALGKHNFILKYTAQAIAVRLGDTLVAPVMEYVPEGDTHPPTGHMRFAGTVSLRPEVFASVLEDTARSLKEHGFKRICFVGEHGASQAVQAEVARKLDGLWEEEGVRVLQIGDYYDQHNGQVEWAHKEGIAEPDIEAHGGLADTAEMLAAYPHGVRMDRRGAYGPADRDTIGAGGSSLAATPEMGKKLLELKINAAVREIQAARQ